MYSGGTSVDAKPVFTPYKTPDIAYQYQSYLNDNNQKFLWYKSTKITPLGAYVKALLTDLGLFVKQSSHVLHLDIIRENDLKLTEGFVKLILLKPEINNEQTALDLLLTNVSDNNVYQLLDRIEPDFEQVALLRKALKSIALIDDKNWNVLDDKFSPIVGLRDQRIKLIRHNLQLLGYDTLSTLSLDDETFFDDNLKAVIREFQKKHGLQVDGIVGPNTYKALNLSPKDRVRLVQLNLRRWFTVAKPTVKEYILVNIPSYQLYLTHAQKTKLQMKVIVGSKKNKTPQLVTHITKITLNPTWTPTFNIIRKELVPEYKRNYLYLKEKNFQLVKGYSSNIEKTEIDQPNINIIKWLKTHRLVQAAGAKNSLGLYRFYTPNDYSIYLHDTPDKSLFKNAYRALSHGCIRLEKPAELADYLLENQNDIKSDSIDKAFLEGKTTHLQLDQTMPVFIVYQTVWVNDGQINFLPDIYDWDQF